MLKRLTRVGVLAAVAMAFVPLQAEVIEQVLVKVNGDIVTQSEFEKRQLAELQSRPELAKLAPNSPEIRKAVAESAPGLILAAVDELLLLQRAKEHGWGLTDDKFHEIVDRIRKENNLDSDEAFEDVPPGAPGAGRLTPTAQLRPRRPSTRCWRGASSGTSSGPLHAPLE